MPQFTIPGLSARQGSEVAKLLQKQLSTYNDLHLTLKHVHWNVVGPSFIGVHQMIDPQVIAVRGYADEVAERIAALGASPQGTPARSSKTGPGTTIRSAATLWRLIWARSTWLYRCHRGPPPTHRRHRKLDPVTQDMLIGHAGGLEQFQWFVRAHLENSGGTLANAGATTEKTAARKAARTTTSRRR